MIRGKMENQEKPKVSPQLSSVLYRVFKENEVVLVRGPLAEELSKYPKLAAKYIVCMRKKCKELFDKDLRNRKPELAQISLNALDAIDKLANTTLKDAEYDY